MSTTRGQISACGNGLAFRLTKTMAKTVGVSVGSQIRVTVGPGRIFVETELEPTLDQMVAAFDPIKHRGKDVTGDAVGVEAFAGRES